MPFPPLWACPPCGSDWVALIDEPERWYHALSESGLRTLLLYYAIVSDHGDNGRLRCRVCCHEYPIPEEVMID